MKRRCAIGILTACVASCAPGQTTYEIRDEDAVPIYRAQIGRYPKLPACVRAAFDKEPADRVQVEAAIETFAPLLTELARAAQAKHCNWTYENPPSITGDYPLDFVLHAGRTLVVRSRIRLEKGDADGALDDMLVLSRFGSDLLQDQWIIGRLSGLICNVWACGELRDQIQVTRPDRRKLASVESHIQLLAGRFPSFKSWFRQEREMAIPLLEEIAAVGLSEVVRRVAKDNSPRKDPDPLVALMEEWLQATLRKDMERAKRQILKRWDELMLPFEEVFDRPLNSGALTAAMENLKKHSKALSHRMARHTLGAGAGDDEALRDAAELIFILWIPAFDKIARNHAVGRLNLQVTLLCSRIELHRLKAGTYPDSLREIGDETPDPFDGGLLKYRRFSKPEGEGFVLTAAGPQGDADRRIHLFSEVCQFDPLRYEEMTSSDLYDVTFGVFRSR